MRTAQISGLLDSLAKDIFEDDAQRARFDTASNHPYECDCKLCKEYWEIMGDEDDDS